MTFAIDDSVCISQLDEEIGDINSKIADREFAIIDEVQLSMCERHCMRVHMCAQQRAHVCMRMCTCWHESVYTRPAVKLSFTVYMTLHVTIVTIQCARTKAPLTLAGENQNSDIFGGRARNLPCSRHPGCSPLPNIYLVSILFLPLHCLSILACSSCFLLFQMNI